LGKTISGDLCINKMTTPFHFKFFSNQHPEQNDKVKLMGHSTSKHNIRTRKLLHWCDNYGIWAATKKTYRVPQPIMTKTSRVATVAYTTRGVVVL